MAGPPSKKCTATENGEHTYLQSIMIHGLLQGGMWSLGAVGWLRGSEGELEDGGSRECTVLAILEPLTASTNSTDFHTLSGPCRRDLAF